MTDRLLAAHAVSALAVGMIISFMIPVVSGLSKKEAVIMSLLSLSQNISGACEKHISQLRGIKVGLKKSYANPTDTITRFELVTGVEAPAINHMVAELEGYGQVGYLIVIHAMNRCNVALSEALWKEQEHSDEVVTEHAKTEREEAELDRNEEETGGDSLRCALTKLQGGELASLQKRVCVGRVAYEVGGQPASELDEEAEMSLGRLNVER